MLDLSKTLPVTSSCASGAIRGACGEEYLQKASRNGLLKGGRRKRRQSQGPDTRSKSNIGTSRACRQTCTRDRLKLS